MNQRSEDETIAGLEIGPMTPLDQLPQFITPEELARILRVGKSLAYELCKKKKVRSKKVGRCQRKRRLDSAPLRDPSSPLKKSIRPTSLHGILSAGEENIAPVEEHETWHLESAGLFSRNSGSRR